MILYEYFRTGKYTKKNIDCLIANLGEKMNEKNIHGRVFKKLREERGYKLKDIAGDVISTRTLNRFEADETSLPIATLK